MKQITTKIGKSLTVLKKDGFWQGGKNILAYLIKFLKIILTPKSGDILIISGGVGDSARYRAIHISEELNLHNLKCANTIQDDPFLARYADKFKIFIFHRTSYSAKVAKLIEAAKKQKKEIIFDTDDLLYDAGYFAMSDYSKQINAMEKATFEGGLGSEIVNDEYVKVCTTTTSFLADKLKEKNKQVFVVPNKLSTEDVEIADEILKNKIIKNSDEIRIGYFSGTLSHNKDFATITDALLEIMEKYPQIKLILVGPLDIESKLNKFADRIKQSPYVPRKEHFRNVAGVDINVSPLEIGNPFCEGKSELKFFGTGILEVPTVASATQTFKEAISDGIDGFVAKNTAEWVEKLKKLITDKEFRINMGKLARDKAVAKYTNKNSNNEEYYNYLRLKL